MEGRKREGGGGDYSDSSLAVAIVAGDDIRTIHDKEGHAGFLGHGCCQARFAGARGTPQQDALGGLDAVPHIDFRTLQGVMQ